MTRAFLVIMTSLAGCSAALAGTIRGYVIDMHGNRAVRAHVEAWHSPPTDLHPPQPSVKLGETTADSHGAFTLALDRLRPSYVLIATFDHQVGTAAPSFHHAVRIPLRPVRKHILRKSSNQALERTADRRDNLLLMTSTLNPEAELALVSGRSACSR
jgi:hypothetical protein